MRGNDKNSLSRSSPFRRASHYIIYVPIAYPFFNIYDATATQICWTCPCKPIENRSIILTYSTYVVVKLCAVYEQNVFFGPYSSMKQFSRFVAQTTLYDIILICYYNQTSAISNNMRYCTT